MKGVVFRSEFTSLPAKVNWFPGHMRKAMRTLDQTLKKTDIFIEVRDARVPRSSENLELLALLPLVPLPLPLVVPPPPLLLQLHRQLLQLPLRRREHDTKLTSNNNNQRKRFKYE